MAKQCYSDIECKIIQSQIERRAKYRKEFLRERSDPCKHAKESGYVFDEALQRFLTLKAYQFYYFKPSGRNALKSAAFMAPFFIYGYLIWNHRNELEKNCRCGRLKPRDRLFKFA